MQTKRILFFKNEYVRLESDGLVGMTASGVELYLIENNNTVVVHFMTEPEARPAFWQRAMRVKMIDLTDPLGEFNRTVRKEIAGYFHIVCTWLNSLNADTITPAVMGMLTDQNRGLQLHNDRKGNL